MSVLKRFTATVAVAATAFVVSAPASSGATPALGNINDQLPVSVPFTMPSEVSKTIEDLKKATKDRLGSLTNPKPVPPKVTVGSNRIENVPERTSIAVATPTGIVKTDNADEPRPGLSIVKLYMAHYVLLHGSGSETERQLSERMIRYSDDGAASAIHRKYPNAISAIAAEYGLKNTTQAAHWGNAYTSATDVAVFLSKLRAAHPGSLVLRWMSSPAEYAADGTRQDWGTATLDNVTGTKWGWSDFGIQSKASASIAPFATVASFSWGGRPEQNADIKAAQRFVR